jgi:hypothetical protein
MSIKIRVKPKTKQGHYKMTPEEVQAMLNSRKAGHVHTDKSRVIPRKSKYK